MIQVQMYGDLMCPFAYIANGRWRQIRDDYSGRVELVHRSLSLEYVNVRANPKRILESQLPVLAITEPDVPWLPWNGKESEWPSTVWPAFEAVKCAELQSLALADDFAWTIRTAFFGENICIALRHVLIELAGKAGLDVERFTTDFDSGKCKQQVIDEARQGWEVLKLPGSPTWVFPSGEFDGDLGLPDISVDKPTGRPILNKAGSSSPEEGRQYLRALLNNHL